MLFNNAVVDIKKVFVLWFVDVIWIWNPESIYLFKVNGKNTRKKCETSKVTVKAPKPRWRRSGVFS